MSVGKKALLGVQLFNGLSAFGGGLALMVGWIPEQQIWVVAGVIMLAWIVGEVASIRGFHILQVIYLLTGVLVLWWTPAGSAAGQCRTEPGPDV